MQNIFSLFKNDIHYTAPQTKNKTDIFIMLFFDKETSAYIDVVNKRKKPVEFDYMRFSGFDRQILQTIHNIKQSNSLSIEWFRDSSKIYLDRYPFLIDELVKTPLFCDTAFNTIEINERPALLKLSIETSKTADTDTCLYKAVIAVQINDTLLYDFVPLNESYLLIDNQLYAIPPAGPHYSKLNLLNTTFSSADLEKYLSLFYSHFHNIKLSFGNYKVRYSGQKKVASCLIISNIDDQNFLHLKISGQLLKFPPEFFEDNNLRKLAVVNELDKTVAVYELLFSDYSEIYNRIMKCLNRYGRNTKNKIHWFFEENTFIISPEVSEQFLKNDIFKLMSDYVVYGAEKLKEYKIITSRPKLNLQLHSGSGIDFLEGSATVSIADNEFTLYDFIHGYKNNAYIMLNDKTAAVIEKKYVDRIKRIFKSINKKSDTVTISFFDLPAVEEMIDNKIENKIFNQSREKFTGFNTINKIRLPAQIVNTTTLRSYQKYGYKWLTYLNKINLNGCLADDMGLGKTIQAISLLNKMYVLDKSGKSLEPSLIIVPKSLLINWQNEIKRFAPDLDYYEYYGTDREFEKAYTHKIIITTYAIVRNDIKTFMDNKFHYIILDESQNIKNLQSKISKAVMLLKSNHRLAISGTPIENNLYELYSLFRFLNPSMFGSKDDFTENYLEPIQTDNDSEVSKELQKKISPFILRRLKKDVAKDLPKKHEQILYVDMEKDHAAFYENRRKYYQEAIQQKLSIEGMQKSRFFIFQALSELRQIAAMPELKTDNTITSPKRTLLAESITDIIGNNHKCLLFTNYLGVIEILAEDFTQLQYNFLTMTGATSNRQELVNRFQNDDAVQIFMMTLKTGGIGLNLTAAEYVFIFDPWWNIAAENQAIDRTHRIGQKNSVFCYKIITRGTIEEKILLLQEKKRDLFNTMINNDSVMAKKLTEADIDYILK